MKYVPFGAAAFAAIAALLAPVSAAPMHPLAAAAEQPIVRILCKYGTPHCVNPHPGPGLPSVGGAKLPDDGWEDPDCKYYGSCGTGTPGNWGDPAAARAGSSMPHSGTGMRMYR